MSDQTAARIARVFNAEFFDSHHTLMSGGATEPLYEPVAGATPARITYTRNYPASALHEAAHWCLAGPGRRQWRDYGYPYVPGPRSAQQRAGFFAAEADVQALEAVFARTCGVRFVVSADDFDASAAELERFAGVVAERTLARAANLPPRARRFCEALAMEFDRE